MDAGERPRAHSTHTHHAAPHHCLEPLSTPNVPLAPRNSQAATRIGAVYVSLPDAISVKALADRLHDCKPSLVLTTADLAPGGSHHGGGATPLKTIVQVRMHYHYRSPGVLMPA